MKTTIPPILAAARMRAVPWRGLNGGYELQGPAGERLRIIASTAEFPTSQGWEHVSVSTRRRTPNWREMCWVKDLFWEPDETVMQLHPPEREWISNHPYCLHLWRHVSLEIPMPPSILVGRQEIGDMSKMTGAQRAEVLRKFNAGDYSR